LSKTSFVAAARPCFIGPSSSTHASITSAAGDVDHPSTVVQCANLLILSISCCLLWVRVSFFIPPSCAPFKCLLPGRFILSFSIQTCPLCTHYFRHFTEWRHELSGMPQRLDQRLTVARPSSHDRYSPSCRSISRSHRQGETTS
jgi:hypothetical protein